MSEALGAEATVAVVGCGTMGGGIAQVAAGAGHRVRLYDVRPEAVEAAVQGVRARLEAAVARGRRSREEVRALLARLQPASSLAELADARLVIEAVAEELAVKRELFLRLEEVVDAEALLASNTSSLSITAIQAGLRRPERMLGLHFFNPAPAMRLVEVVCGLATAEETAGRAAATMRRWGKEPIRVRNTPGFVVNRVARPFYGEGLALLAEGIAQPATLDAIYRDCGGFRMGPCELTDLIGQDVNAAVSRALFVAYRYDRRYLPPLIQEELVEAGRLGRKSGRGFYDYGPGAVRPAPQEEPPGPPARALVVEGPPGPLAPWVALAERRGLAVRRQEGSGLLAVGEAVLVAADGRSAGERALVLGRPVVAVDLCLDAETAPRVALAASPDLSGDARSRVAGFFQTLGKRVSFVADLPGMVVLRTVAMLANEAAEAVREGVASAEDVDRALCLGANYPLGPLAWAERVGIERLVACLDRLERHYRDPRYRCSPWLRRELVRRRLVARERR